MDNQPVSDERFTLQSSLFLEEIVEVLNRRINYLLLFAQIFLGSAVMSQFGSPIFIGLTMAVIAALQLTFRFGEKASQARSQKLIYEKLCRTYDKGEIDSAISQHADIIKDDSEVSGTLKMISHQCAIIALDENDRVRLSYYHRAIACFAGQTQILMY